jgi:hypothetical protein
MIENISFLGKGVCGCPLWKTGLHTHLTQWVLFLVFTHIVAKRLQKMIAIVPPLKKGGQGGFEAFLNPPKSPFAKGGLAAQSIP